MSCETETASLLRSAGQKVTPQRMLVLAALRHHASHVTAAELLDDARRLYPFLDISTVYRTLASARDLNLVSEFSRPGGDAHYEWIGQTPHHHLICRICGSETDLEPGTVDGLAEDLEREHGFRADLKHFTLFGVCRDCQAKGLGGD